MSSYFAIMSGCQKLVPAGSDLNSTLCSTGLQIQAMPRAPVLVVSCAARVPPNAWFCSSASCVLTCLATILALRGWFLV